jgi:hypothetical protein
MAGFGTRCLRLMPDQEKIDVCSNRPWQCSFAVFDPNGRDQLLVDGMRVEPHAALADAGAASAKIGICAVRGGVLDIGADDCGRLDVGADNAGAGYF